MLDINRLINAYTNEKSTKILLQYDTIVDDFNASLKDYILLLKSSSETSSLIHAIQEIEVERVGYFIKEYIQCRYDKIRSNLYLNTNLMSAKEQTFYEKYIELIKCNGTYQENVHSENGFVGFVANKNLDAVKIDDMVVKIYKGDFFVTKYEDVAELLKENAIYLS